MKRERIFLASPYSNPDPVIMDGNAAAAERTAALLIKSGLQVFSPIAYSHQMAIRYSMPRNAAWWADFNNGLMRDWATEVHVLKIKGWSKSIGVTAELELAESLNLPIKHIDEP